MGLFRRVKYTEKTISFHTVPNLAISGMIVTFKLLFESVRIYGSIKGAYSAVLVYNDAATCFWKKRKRVLLQY